MVEHNPDIGSHSEQQMMQHGKLAIATTVALGLALAIQAPQAAARGEHAAAVLLDTNTYIVLFDDAPLATFRGSPVDASPAAGAGAAAGKALAATSPAVTGAARLDVDAPASRAYRAYLAQRRENHLAAASARFGRPLVPSHVYDVVLNGVAVELDAVEAAELALQPGVARVEPDWVDRIQTDAGPPWIKAPEIWNGAAGLQSRGEGVVVGVIDTGINASHLSFAATSGGFTHSNPKGQFLGLCATGQATCNGKLIGIYDLSTGTDDKEPNNGLDLDGHGSHVASTAVGNPLQASISGTTRSLSGVAPRANLISYKACEGEAQCQGAWLLAALNQAVTDQVDVINYSIGGGARSPWQSSDAAAMRSAREAGILTVVAAGNDGPAAGTVTSPGNAPWVLTVAAATHTRLQGNQLLLSGGDTPPPDGGSLFGASATGGSATLTFDRDPNHPLCGVGDGIGLDANGNPDGSTNPWPTEPTRFSGGKIVTCLRGTHARIAKSDNVRRAGGSASVLINQAFDGASIIADAHSIPTTHLSFEDGQKLFQWLATGSGHTGRLTASVVQDLPGRADLLASFSGRGPNAGDSIDLTGVLKPDITAPGVSVLAAVETGNDLGFKSGTSMATPHVTGAAALLIGATRKAGKSPAWGPDQLISALAVTARSSVLKPDGSTPADAFDQGAGVVDLARAIRGGLYFPRAASGFPTFLSANPAAGGQPRNLNLPSLTHQSCFQNCQFTRRVVDTRGGGSWQVVAELPQGMSLSSNLSQFTLAANAGQTLTFDFSFTNPALTGKWQFGRIRLRNLDNDGTSDTVMPVTIFVDPGNVPASIEATVASDAGNLRVAMSGLVGLPSARFAGTALAPRQRVTVSLAQDPTEDEPYDGGAGVHFFLVTVPQDPQGVPRRWRLRVDAASATSQDVDLFVGEDSNGSGQPDESEESCASTAPDATERCDIVIEHSGSGGDRRFWVLAQNWDAGPSGVDQTLIDHALVLMEPENRSLVASGPGHVDAQQQFDIRLGWDDVTLLPGESRLGYLLLSPVSGSVMAEIPVVLTRAGGEPAARALRRGQPQRVRLPASSSHEKMFFDVPINATSLTVSMTSAAAYDLYLAKGGGGDPGNAGIDPAPPRSQAVRQVTGSLATKTITLSGADLSPGRWYITPVGKAGGTVAEVTVTIDSQTAAPVRRLSHYFNTARPGHGLLLDDAGNGGVWAAVWYAYLPDGTPTWYLLQNTAPGVNDGQWSTPIFRSAWDGAAFSLTEVGQGTLSFNGVNGDGFGALTFSYMLDGQTGSESMTQLIGSGSCPSLSGSPLNVTGHWFSPAKPGFGYSVQVESNVEFFAAYLYDRLGVPRWLLAQRAGFQPAANALDVEQFVNGPCPACSSPGNRSSQVVGVLNRSYGNGTLTGLEVAAQFASPLAGDWLETLPVALLSDPKVCP